MSGIRYKFKRVVVDNAAVEAEFEKGLAGLLGMVAGKDLVREDEVNCKDLYESACGNADDSHPNSPSANSREDARRGFNEIRRIKRQKGIPLDVDGPDL